MKRIILLTFAILLMGTINSCKEDKEIEPDPIPNKDVTAEKTSVKTFEIINLISRENLASKYNATFGSAAIELIRTSDSTLTFYVPDIQSGEAHLKFDLATIKFNVTKSAEVNVNQFITDLNQNFETQVSLLNPSTPDETAEINDLKEYRQEVLTLFNSLTDSEKRQAALFYEANKAVFKSYATNTFSNLDTSTAMRKQSKCPRTDFKAFYGCTAENLGNAAIGLKSATGEFLKMMGMAGVMAGVAYNTSVLGPAAWGITAVGISLPLGAAGYLLITEVRPAALHFKHSLSPFLRANWIFSKALFQSTTEVFHDQVSTSLSLSPKFRSINSSDSNVSSGSRYFISAMASLSEYWNKMASIFGDFPTYKNSEASTTLSTNEISISNISNSNVQYLGNTGQSVKFKSITGKEENFSYNIKINKEGFVEEKTLNGKVLAVVDSIPLYTASAIGVYTVNGPPAVGNGPNSRLVCELKSGGVAVYTIYDDPSWPNGYKWNIGWQVRKVNNRYYILTGWTNPGYQQAEAKPLTYPVSSFVYRHSYVK